MAVVLAFFWLASSSAWGHGLRYIAANVLKFKIWINKQQFVLDVLIFLGGKVLKSFSRSKVFNLFFFGFNVSIRIFQTSCYWFTTHFHERKNISKKSKIKFFCENILWCVLQWAEACWRPRELDLSGYWRCTRSYVQVWYLPYIQLVCMFICIQYTSTFWNNFNSNAHFRYLCYIKFNI